MFITDSRPTDFLSMSEKTSYMIIPNQKNTIDIRISDSILTKITPVKFLGIKLDENLTFNDHVKNVTTKIPKSVGAMRRLHCQLPADEMVKLNYSLVYSHLTCAFLAGGRSGHSNATKNECAHRRTRKLLTNYNHRILTFYSIYDYFALLKAFNTNTLNVINISETNYLLINHLICTTPDREEIVILILTFESLKNSKMLFVPGN